MEGQVRTEPRRVGGGRAAREWPWRVAALVLGTFVLSFGCNPMTLTYFLFEPDHLEPPLCAIACEGKDVKVVLLAEHVNLPTNPILTQADSELSYRLTQLLEQRYKENKDRVQIVSTSDLKAYKNSHPKWKEQTAQEIGRHFKADYVISLEINDIRLYDPKNRQFFYHGYADIDLTVTDVHKPVGEGEKFRQPYSLEYPRAPLERTDMTVNQFRAKLIDRICKDLVQFFAAHPPRDKYDRDQPGGA